MPVLTYFGGAFCKQKTRWVMRAQVRIYANMYSITFVLNHFRYFNTSFMKSTSLKVFWLRGPLVTLALDLFLCSSLILTENEFETQFPVACQPRQYGTSTPWITRPYQYIIDLNSIETSIVTRSSEIFYWMLATITNSLVLNATYHQFQTPS